MHLAAVDGSETIIKMLLDVGANTNVQNYLGWTPLHCAISMDQLDLLPILLKGGAKPDIADKAGRLPFESTTSEASRQRLVEILEPLGISL